MRPHTEGKKGTCYTGNYSIYTVEKRGGKGGGDNPGTMLERRMALQETQGIQAHVDNIRLLTAQQQQHWLHACTGAGV